MTNRDVIDDLADLLYPQPDRGSVLTNPRLGPDSERDRGDISADDLVHVGAADVDEQDLGEEFGQDLHGDELDDEAFEAACEDVAQQRREFVENLRLAQDNATDFYEFDPLIGEIAAARRDQREAEQRLRLLLAYAREFTPRPHPLAELARVTGMSTSGVRTAYADTEIAEVTARIGRPGRDHVMALRTDTGPEVCAAFGGRRNHRGAGCGNPPTLAGGAPHTDKQFAVCTAHAWMVSNPQPLAPVR